MITCSSCGRDNQDHYKFCLSCGTRLGAPTPPPKSVPAVLADAAALGMAKTDPPPPTTTAAPAPSPVAVPAPSPVAADPRRATAGVLGGAAAPRPAPDPAPPAESIALADTTPPPELMPPRAVVAPRVEAPVVVAPAVVAPQVSAPLRTAVPEAAPASPARAGTLAPAAAAAPRPTSLGTAAAPGAALPVDSAAGTPGPAATGGPVVARDTIPCPNCGKPVVATYAFCGACGHRLKPAPTSTETTPAVRTMFMAAPAAKPAPRGHLTLIRPDGTEGGMHPLVEGENLVGRGQGPLFDADPYLSPRHAEFVLTAEGLIVRDLRSLNGVFVKIAQDEKLDSGDTFRIGQELLRFDLIAPPTPLEDGTELLGTPNPGYWGRASVIVGRDVEGPAFPLFDESIVLGRERGDILFPEDGYVSGTHAQITLKGGQVYLSDLGSSNGTFLRIRGSRPLPAGTLVLMGQQLFRVAFR